MFSYEKNVCALRVSGLASHEVCTKTSGYPCLEVQATSSSKLKHPDIALIPKNGCHHIPLLANTHLGGTRVQDTARGSREIGGDTAVRSVATCDGMSGASSTVVTWTVGQATVDRPALHGLKRLMSKQLWYATCGRRWHGLNASWPL